MNSAAPLWNEAAYKIVGRGEEGAGGDDELVALEKRAGGPLPEAVREWFLFGGDRRLAAVSANRISPIGDLARSPGARMLDSGYLLLETDSQHSCRWVVPLSAAYGDPPVYLIDPDDHTCVTRSRYAAAFSDYTRTAAWDAMLWKGELSVDFDHALPPDALDVLDRRLTRLPVTHGWAMNQSCDAVHRFDGEAQVAIAVTGSTAVWSAVAAPATAIRKSLTASLGAG